MQPSPRFTHPASIATAALVALALIVAIALMIPGVSSAAPLDARVVVGPAEGSASALAAGARPRSSAKVNSCSSGFAYDKRKIEFSGRMETFSDARPPSGKMQMRFDVLRKYNESKKWRLLRADGLSEWLGNTEPTATVYVRNIALSQIETSAQYKSRVRYRWLDDNGKVIHRKLRTTKTCKQKAPLPDPGVLEQNTFQLAGQPNAAYVVRIYNFSKSEAINVPVFLAIDGGVGETQMIDSIAGKETVELTFNASACKKEIAVRVNPLKTVREQQLIKNNDLTKTC